MKIFGLDINFNRVQDIDRSRPNQADLYKKITVPNQLYRTRQDIASWLSALRSAESIYNPNRTQLYRLYKDIVLDAHVSACIDQRKNLVKSLEFYIELNDEENEELTKLIETKWFRDFMDYALDSIYYGYSLVQFEDIVNNTFKDVSLIPRQYVKPEFHIVVSDTSALTGTDYLEMPYANWAIGVGNKCDLGLLAKVAPLFIWKKGAMGAWAEFSEKFGTPIRIGRTDKTDAQTVNKMEDMLRNMATSAWGLFGTEDMIELIETNKSDAHQVFDMLVQRCNSEISKLILNQTGTTDEKSYVGSAEVQERILKNVGYNDQFMFENVCNTQLVPMMQRLGLLPDGAKICVEGEEDLKPEDKLKYAIELVKTGKYTIPAEVLSETFGITVEDYIEPDNGVQSIQNKLNDLYK